jgi:hypothetical protein
VNARRAALAVSLAVLGALAVPARGDDAPAPAAKRVALEPLSARGVSVPIAQVVEERICQALGEAAKAEVVCPADVATVTALAKTAGMFGECAADDCVKRVDAATAAERRVRGTLRRGERGLVLELALVGPDGLIRQASDRLPEDVDAMVEHVPAVVKKLFP